MTGYYNDKLSSKKLKRCYELAPARVRRYLEAEVDHVLGHVRPGDAVLELGCGYGRILPRLASVAGTVMGIDTSISSLRMGGEVLHGITNCFLACMDAVRLGFGDGVFDLVVCIQNGISAFHVNKRELVRESMRVAKPGHTLLFSSYSDKFWEDRLEWFVIQSREGLLGEIDYERTANGEIVCKDGFTATTVGPKEFTEIMKGLNAETKSVEVDDSSVFFEVVVG